MGVRSVAQERAADFFITQVDKVETGVQNEQGNVLYVLLDQHKTKSEAGEEIAKFLIDRSGFVIWVTYEPGCRDEFKAIFDEYIRAVGIVHPTEYGEMNPAQNAAESSTEQAELR